ncbi:MAG: PorT family protein [Paramuribaculum sp.]|nr:PorT family protein [Paramuribaculum sp.]
MKKILLTLAVILGCMNAQAYDVFDNKDNHSYFGVRLSYELCAPTELSIDNINKQDWYNASSGLNLGVIYNMPLWKNLYFEPGLTFYYNTIGVKTDNNISIRSFGARIPLLIGYHFDILPSLQLSLFTGPEIALGFTACQWNHIESDEGNFSIVTNAYDSALNRFDIKWRFGVGATFLDRYYAAISGAAGLCDQVKGPFSAKANLFDITLGYNF